MSFCNLTEQIHDHECLGDSLNKINQNFQNLDFSLCDVPTPIAGQGINIDFKLTEQKQNEFVVSTNNSFDYKTTFDSYNNLASSGTISLNDGTNLNVTNFPYNSLTADPKPTTTFTSVSLTNNAQPKVTLYWTASGTNNTATVYSLNSATDEINRGPIWFNDTVVCVLSSTQSIYVGGSFTQVGGTFAQKLVEINTTGNGSLTSVPIPNLGSYGEIKVIKEVQVMDSTSTVNTLLIAGGSFESNGIRGRGLVVLNKTLGIYYPWYINGEVNDLCFNTADNETLYVGGKFDYVNYGATSASVFSNQRRSTNGFFAINLQKMIDGLAVTSITDYSQPFVGEASVNAFAFHKEVLYIGGSFKIKDKENIINKNIYSIDTSNLFIVNYWDPDVDWQIILNGPVFGLHIDDATTVGDSTYLYVGGKFSEVHSSTEYYSTPRTKLFINKASNAICFKLTNGLTKLVPPTLTTWKPSFRGPVTTFLSQDSTVESPLYCYGLFNAVEDKTANYLIAIKKACSLTSGQLYSNWTPGIQNGPSIINKAIIKHEGNVIVGGNFTKVSNNFRYNLAKVVSAVSSSLPYVVWDCGAEVITPGNKLSMDLYSSSTMRISSVPGTFETVNAAVFPVMVEGFAGITSGQPIRFFVRRPGKTCNTDDTFIKNAHVIGWKVDYNQ